MAHQLSVYKNFKGFRYRTEFEVVLGERLNIKASSMQLSAQMR